MISIIKLTNVYIKTFYLKRFILTSSIFNLLFFFYYDNYFIDGFTWNFQKIIYHGRFFEVDFMGGIIWSLHIIIILYFVGSCIENHFYSKITSILCRVSRDKWYLSYAIFFIFIIFIYLLTQLLTYILFILIKFKTIFYFNEDKLADGLFEFIQNSFFLSLSLFIFMLLFFVCYILIKLKFAFVGISILCLIEAFIIDERFIVFFPAAIGMLKGFNFSGPYILSINIIYLILFSYIGMFLIKKIDILKSKE